MRLTKRGFPSVHALDGDVVSESSKSSDDRPKRDGKVTAPKSLFAQQFEKHGLEYFGIEASREMQPEQTAAPFPRDLVEPISLGSSSIEIEHGSGGNSKLSVQSVVTEPMATIDTTTVLHDKGEERDEYGSKAAQSWDR